MAEQERSTATDPRTEGDALDAIDALTAEASHLEAMLSVIQGVGFDTFSRYNPEIQQRYLWACTERARAVRTIADRL